jgi:hypothetical protein
LILDDHQSPFFGYPNKVPDTQINHLFMCHHPCNYYKIYYADKKMTST